MKTALIILFSVLLIASSFSQNLHAERQTGIAVQQRQQPYHGPVLRLINTNLYDFSNAGTNFQHQGTVTRLYPHSAEISFPGRTGYYLSDSHHDPAPQTVLDMAIQREESERAFKMGYDTNGEPRMIPLGAYLVMSPSMRSYFQLGIEYQKIYLSNPPPLQIGREIIFNALPTTVTNVFEYGIPFTGDTNDFKYIFYLQNDRIVRGTNSYYKKP